MSQSYQKFKRFSLPRQIFKQPLEEVISRSIEEQEIELDTLSLKQRQQMAERLKDIQEKGLPEGFIVQKISEEIGCGVFLHPEAKPLEKGSIIAPYSGVVFLAPQSAPDNSAYTFAVLTDIKLKKIEQKKYDKKHAFHPRRLYALNLDADQKGNFTRFINHSSKPNVEAEIYKMGKNKQGLEAMPLEVIYLAKKKILPGEQLLVCYEDEEESYWKPMGIKPFPMNPKTFVLNKDLQVVQLTKK